MWQQQENDKVTTMSGYQYQDNYNTIPTANAVSTFDTTMHNYYAPPAGAPPTYDEVSQLRQRNAQLQQELARREREDMQRHMNEQIMIAQMDAARARQEADQIRSGQSLRDCLCCCLLLECCLLGEL